MVGWVVEAFLGVEEEEAEGLGGMEGVGAHGCWWGWGVGGLVLGFWESWRTGLFLSAKERAEGRHFRECAVPEAEERKVL